MSENKPNGQNEEPGMTDIRTVPTGTLIFNLILVASKEQGAMAMIMQLQAMKEQQKLVVAPPQLEMMMHEKAALEQARYAMASELNSRFRDVDEKRVAALGIEIFEPGDTPVPPEGQA